MALAFAPGALAPAHCHAAVRASVRAARGRALQHGADAAAAVLALESYLGEEGHAEADWEGAAGSWERPYRARFLRDLVSRAVASGGEEPLPNVCVLGFGAGHTATLLLTAAGAPQGGGETVGGVPSRVRVLSFDKATNRAAVPASDFLDVRFPDRSALFLGEPSAALERFRVAFPGMLCSVLLLEPHPQQPLLGNATAQALRALRRVAAPGHVLVLAGGREQAAAGSGGGAAGAAAVVQQQAGSPAAPGPAAVNASALLPGAVWRQAEAAGWLSWEGTLLETAGEGTEGSGDSVLYGALQLDGAAWPQLAVERAEAMVY